MYVPLSGYENDDTIRSFDYRFKFQDQDQTNDRQTKQLQYQLYKVYILNIATAANQVKTFGS